MSVGAAIFVKTPGLSPLKTRLAAAIGTAAATAWYRAAAAATGAVTQRVATLAPYWAVAEDPAASGSAWPGLPLLAQGAGDLGARMGRVHTMLVERHGAGLLLGADTPQLDPAVLARAAAWLDDPAPHLVMGPARDGGFWLIGANRLLDETAWTEAPCGTAETAAGFRAAMAGAGAWLELPPLTDVDERADLAPMLAELAQLAAPLPAQQLLADASRAYIG
ncbi:DUF2064 domain-containing protein [Thioalkalivibrio sp. XN279]|uniref:TIGR04282 family arsenosugar biosynthesis glycosyltransferase n=1 Tax=Thioalkalivibrio sp. XN279 TaxID=2714953 RepID=UPI00140A4BB9|nr:DUF2064 domain-containing protein [Thioalkalivibrio sp. XN279]NHA13492.1 DUF2064 domain-containing protein [Thioalkalivibrio sp. XN279]